MTTFTRRTPAKTLGEPNPRAPRDDKVKGKAASLVMDTLEQALAAKGKNLPAFWITADGAMMVIDYRLSRLALRDLMAAGIASDARRKISVRVDPGVLQAAGERLGVADTTEIVNSALALAAAPNPFHAWLAQPPGTLSDDFELAI